MALSPVPVVVSDMVAAMDWCVVLDTAAAGDTADNMLVLGEGELADCPCWSLVWRLGELCSPRCDVMYCVFLLHSSLLIDISGLES